MWQFFLESCRSFKLDQLVSPSHGVTVSHSHAVFMLHLDVIQLGHMTHPRRHCSKVTGSSFMTLLK